MFQIFIKNPSCVIIAFSIVSFFISFFNSGLFNAIRFTVPLHFILQAAISLLINKEEKQKIVTAANLNNNIFFMAVSFNIIGNYVSFLVFSYQQSAIRNQKHQTKYFLSFKNLIMHNFKELAIWQRSHSLTLKIYSVSKNFPKDEMFGLTSQIRRSSSSIPTNIAEGCGRSSNAELNRFLVISAGSSSELQYQLILSKDLGYIIESKFKELHDETIQIRKMIYSYCDKL